MSICRVLDEDPPRVIYQHQSRTVTLNSEEELFKYLRDNQILLPICMFSYDPEVQPRTTFSREHWKSVKFRMDDLSRGLEPIPIPVICESENASTNLVPYLKERILDNNLDPSLKLYHDDEFLECCDCENDCEDNSKCACFQKAWDNCSVETRESVGQENFGYRFQRLGRSFLSGIFECNKNCKCRQTTCVRRVVQNGITCHLQLFMTSRKGWGVRTLCDIPEGTFICEYAGKIISGELADKMSDDWHGGKWKYLSLLDVGEVKKDGYESDVAEDVIEKELVKMKMDQAEHPKKISSITVPEDENRMFVAPGEEEWRDFLSTEDDDDMEEVIQQKVPSPKPKSPKRLRMKGSKVRRSQKDKLDSNANGTSSAESPKPPSLLNDRSLRSYDPLPETPQIFQTMPLGISGVINRSWEETKTLSRLNEESARLSKVCFGPSRKNKTSKQTTYLFVEEYDLMMGGGVENHYEELAKKKRELEKEKKKLLNKREQATRLSDKIIFENVVKSVKIPGVMQVEIQNLPDMLVRARRAMMGPKVSVARLHTRSRRKPLFKKILHRANAIAKRVRRRKRVIWTIRKPIPAKPRNKRESHKLLKFDLNIDGSAAGNIGRYFNHSCDPNVFAQFVFIDSHDLRLPHIGLFANRTIKAGEELAWNYNYELEEPGDNSSKKDIGKGRSKSILSRSTQEVRMDCFCGADNCKKRVC